MNKIKAFYQNLIKQPKDHKIAIGAHILGALTICFLAVSPIIFQNHSTFKYMNDHQADPYSIGFQQLKQSTKDTALNEVAPTTIFVLYKDTCSVCDKYQKDIIDLMNTVEADKETNINIYYVDATKETPKWLFKNLAIKPDKDMKTPYIFELRGDLHTGSSLDKVKYYPIVRGRLDSPKKIAQAKLHLLSGAKVQESQIGVLTNLDYLDN